MSTGLRPEIGRIFLSLKKWDSGRGLKSDSLKKKKKNLSGDYKENIYVMWGLFWMRGWPP